MRKTNIEISSDELQGFLSKTWDATELTRKFRVSKQTIHKWLEKPGPNKTTPPAVVIPGSGRVALRFVPEEIRAWAKENNRKLYGDAR